MFPNNSKKTGFTPDNKKQKGENHRIKERKGKSDTGRAKSHAGNEI